jgi:hypothetical protein
MDIKEIVCEVEDLIHVAHDRDQLWALVNTVMQFSAR